MPTPEPAAAGNMPADTPPAGAANSIKFEFVDRDIPPPVKGWPQGPLTRRASLRCRAGFERNLRRYVETMFDGRSYLIAGHRGSGKTSLVLDVVEAMRQDIFLRSVAPAGVETELIDGPFCRPLLVKLHGPSLIESSVPGSLASITKSENVSAALEQIMVALYRSLAQEVHTGYLAHARMYPEPHRPQLEERAAQLALLLDGGAPTHLLRSYWRALGRLDRGILWPADADATLRQHRMTGQGLREIVALATAGQAFQVCAGRVQYKTQVISSAERERANGKAAANGDAPEKEKSTPDAIDKTARLGALGLGVGSAAATAHSTLPGTFGGLVAPLLAGLGVWLAGLLSLSWRTTVRRKSDEKLEYSFLRKTDASTLNRDLPLVVERMRSAGLTPVFMVDELDKIGDDALSRIKAVIRPLKPIINDHGFFCFMANKDLYFSVTDRIDQEAYPEESTLFSSRVLIHADMTDTIEFLLEIIESTGENDAASKRARLIEALCIVYNSRANFNDMWREIAKETRRKDGWIATVNDVLTATSRPTLALIQLAILDALARTGLQERGHNDERFAHRLFDAAWFLPRQWQERYGSLSRQNPDVIASGFEVDWSMAALRAYLNKREVPALPDRIGDEELADLHDLVTAIAANLAAPGSFLPTGMLRLQNKDYGDVPFAQIVSDHPPIISGMTEDNCTFAYAPSGAPVKPLRLDPNTRARIGEFARVIRRLLDLLRDNALYSEDFAACRLPLVTTTAQLREFVKEFEQSKSMSEPTSSLQNAVRRWSAHARDLARYGQQIAALLLLHRALPGPPGSAKLARIGALIPIDREVEQWPGFGIDGFAPLPAPDFLGTFAELRSFRLRLRQLEPWREPKDFDADATAEQLLMTIAQWLDGSDDIRLEPTVDDLALAAQDRFPQALLHENLSRMTNRDWTRLALAALAQDPRARPYPMGFAVAALRALGIGRTPLLALATSGENSDSKTGMALAHGARESQPATIVVAALPNALADEIPQGQTKPILILDQLELEGFAEQLARLRAIGAVDLVATER